MRYRTSIGRRARSRVGRRIDRIDAHTEVAAQRTTVAAVSGADAPLKADVAFPIEPDRLAAVTPGYTAHRPADAVAAVFKARPGLLDTADLPIVAPTFS